MGKYVERINRNQIRIKRSGLLLILSIVLICLDLASFIALYFQTLSGNFLQNIFLLSVACSLTIPLCIFLASQFKIYRNNVGRISNLNRNGRKDPVLEKLVPTPIALPWI